MTKKNLLGHRFGRLVVLWDTGKRKQRKVIWECMCDCGNIIEVPTTYLTTGDTSSCGCLRSDNSKKLMTEIARNNFGSNNNRWRGGVSPEYMKIRGSEEYKTWRQSVFIRDNFTCQKCMVSQKYLNAHHILSFAEYEDHRFDIDNGITLCKDCHTELHGLYGNDVLPEELMEYLNG